MFIILGCSVDACGDIGSQSDIIIPLKAVIRSISRSVSIGLFCVQKSALLVIIRWMKDTFGDKG